MPDGETSSTPAEQANTGYIPGHDLSTRWGNSFRLLFGQMTDEGALQWKQDRDEQNEEADCARCVKHRDYLLMYSPIIRFMRQNINKLGGDVHQDNIRCRKCTHLAQGGFDKDYGILLCANNLRRQGDVEDTLAHEMVHAYDHLRFQVQWEAASADGFASSGKRASGSLHNNFRNASDEERHSQWRNDQSVKTMFKPPKLSMRSGIVVFLILGHLMKFIDEQLAI
ncbi:MAG: hypothetical protein Q9219_001172 [cf. Caloplaca sp. 3 TL-2023]